MAQTLQNKGKKIKTFESFNDVTTNFEAPLPVADNFIDSIIDFNTSSATSTSSNSFDEIQYTQDQDNEHHQCCTRCKSTIDYLSYWDGKLKKRLDETPQHPKNIRSLPGEQRQVETINNVMSSVINKIVMPVQNIRLNIQPYIYNN